VLVITAVAMLILIASVGLVVDVGHALLVRRQLQAGVDAAALAAAQELPIAANVQTVAAAYGPTPGSKNSVGTVDNATTNVTLRCIKSAPGCSNRYGTVNALTVSASSTVPTLFARLLGFRQMTVNARATACSPCASKPLDVMIVLDRTGSMCQFSDTSSDPNCTDLKNAKEGIRTFTRFMDPALDKLGLAVFPPALDRSSLCTAPSSSRRNYGYSAYWPEWIPDPRGSTPSVYAIGSLVDDYLVKVDGEWDMNPASSFTQLLDCTVGVGTTSYSNAVEEAQHELDTHGRGNVEDVIIFLSDGAANTTPSKLPAYADTSYNRSHPCAAGVAVANNVKARNTTIYTIGYDLNGMGTDPESCKLSNGNVDTTMTAYDAIRAMASDPTNFYNKPNPGQLATIFTRIAADLAKPAARLMDDNVE
jgi:Flp pilus assembly protein TadG